MASQLTAGRPVAQTVASSRTACPVGHNPRSYVGFKAAGTLGLGCTDGAHDKFWSRTRQAIASAKPSGGPRRQVTRMMPIGVPRVPYRTPKENVWQWVDIWNCLYRERIIFLSKPVDEELGNQLVATMLYLDSENRKDLNLYINCSGGEVVPCLALYDTMRHIGSDVSTVGFGACFGMSGFLLAVGKKGKRYVLPNTSIMLHHPSGTARGQASDIYNEARELMRLRDYVNNVLSLATGQPVERLQHELNRNKYLEPKEALEYGVIDQIVKPRRREILSTYR